MECPKEFARAAQISYLNGIYGYQFSLYDNEATFLICLCDGHLAPFQQITWQEHTEDPVRVSNRKLDLRDQELRQLTELRRRSGSDTIKLVDGIVGTHILEISWYEYGLIPAIFNAMLSMGLQFRTANKAKVHFGPAGIGFPPQAVADKEFTPLIMERKHLAKLYQLRDEAKKLFADREDPLVGVEHEHPWNYITEEGGEFCGMLRQLRKLGPVNFKDNYFTWKSFKDLDCEEFCMAAACAISMATNGVRRDEKDITTQLASSTTSQLSDNKSAPKKILVVPDPEEDLCYVCMERKIETIVLPCHHSVVCLKCSGQLSLTSNAKVCVKCQRAITTILNLEGKVLAKLS